MPRLQDRILPDSAGSQRARAALSFGKEHGAEVARVRVEAELPLRCERCMGEVLWPVDAQTTLALVASLAAAELAPAGLEPVLAAEGRVVLRDLVEEELLLALPLVARHERVTDCQARIAEVAAEAEITQQPFAQLKELLKQR
jgi:uncharacterized protein